MLDASTPQTDFMNQQAPLPPIDTPAHQSKRASLLIMGLLLLVFVVGIYYVMMAFRPQDVVPIATATPTPEENLFITVGKITIGTDATYPPMEYLEDENLVGYDIDLGNEIADSLGVEVEFKNIPWDDLFEALKSGEVDAVLSSVTITDERKEEYTFSQPYLNAGQVIITHRDTTDISSTDDLLDKRIGVQVNTTNEEEARKYTSADLVISFDDFEKAADALVNQEVDAIFSDLTNAKGIVSDNSELRIASDPFTSEFYGIVLRKGDQRLEQRLNDILSELDQRGVLVFLKQNWLE